LTGHAGHCRLRSLSVALWRCSRQILPAATSRPQTRRACWATFGTPSTPPPGINAALPIAPAASPMSRTEVSERFDPARFDAASETYIVPSYDGGKARIAVDPTGAIPAPPDWDGVARRLRDPNPLVRSYAFYNIHGLVEAGDEQAVRIAIWGIRADDEDPRAQIFASLRILASRNPKRFRELLRALRDAYQSMLRGRFKRTETTVLITVSEAAALHILGALERVALTIPKGVRWRMLGRPKPAVWHVRRRL